MLEQVKKICSTSFVSGSLRPREHRCKIPTENPLAARVGLEERPHQQHGYYPASNECCRQPSGALWQTRSFPWNTRNSRLEFEMPRAIQLSHPNISAGFDDSFRFELSDDLSDQKAPLFLSPHWSLASTALGIGSAPKTTIMLRAQIGLS